jgi:hypothetical protein
MFDYVFVQLGVNEDNLAHPIAMTETLGNPLYSRSRACLSVILSA